MIRRKHGKPPLNKVIGLRWYIHTRALWFCQGGRFADRLASCYDGNKSELFLPSYTSRLRSFYFCWRTFHVTPSTPNSLTCLLPVPIIAFSLLCSLTRSFPILLPRLLPHQRLALLAYSILRKLPTHLSPTSLQKLPFWAWINDVQKIQCAICVAYTAFCTRFSILNALQFLMQPHIKSRITH